MKKKKIIIGIIMGVIVVSSATIIPIFIVNNNNDDEQENNKKIVEEIIKNLKNETLILASNSTGKIIGDNKKEIISKIKKLIGIEKLRGVKFDVSLENDVDISTTEKFIIVTVKKEKHSQQLKGKNGLKVKRAKNVQEIKIDTIKEYLNNSDNLNLTLPKTNYRTDNEILVAIRKLLATQINNIEIDDTNLIIKKENSSEVVLVATHSDEEKTSYEITIDDEDFTLNLNQKEFSEDEKNVKNIKQSLESLISKEITIDKSSGSITTNKDSILEKLQALSGYPLDLKGVIVSIKEEETEINLEGIAFIIELSKGSVVNQELRGFTVKRNQSQAEIDQNDINEVERLLNTLTSKEVTIVATSGTINDNKEAILTQIQALSGYSELNLKGVTISIKESPTIITPLGINVELTLTKNGQSKDVSIFRVKRSQTQAEIDQNDVNEIKKLLESLTSKEITIDESNGSITTNKDSILGKLQSLSGYPSDLRGVSLSIKDSSDLITLEGVAFTIKLSKGSVDNELTTFIVKRSQTQAEIDQNDVNEIKQSLESLTSKEITIDESNGSISTNKDSILGKLQSLSGYPSDLRGVSLSIKDSSDLITLEGVAFTIKLSKGSVDNELTTFIVKRSQTQVELNQDDVNQIKKLLESLTSKEIIIDESSGSITNNKDSILEKLQSLSGYPSDLKGVSLSIKDSSDSITLEGVAFTIKLSKSSVDNELTTFIVKRSQSQIEIDQNDVNEIKNALNTLNPKEITIDESSGSITTNKDSILRKLQSLSGYLSNLKGVSLSIKDSSDLITLEGVAFTIKLSKGSVDNELTKFIVKRSQTPIEKMRNNIKKHLKVSINLDISLPKDTGSDYDEDSKILAAIRKKLEILKPLDFSKNDFDNLINKKQTLTSTPTLITKVATHDEPTPTSYEITIDGEDFTLQLKQNQYNSEQEKNKIINLIKTYLENEDNLNLILPKDTNSNYDKDSKILTAIKTKLINSIPNFKNYDANLIVKEGSTLVTQVATYDSIIPTLYEITIGEKNFILKLKQDQFTKEEKTKINAIKTYLESLDNFNLILPKTTYDTNDSILEAIKLKIVNDIENITNDDSYLIVKNGLILVNSVATHNETPTQYIITIEGEDFTLNLNQEKFSIEEKNKIQIIKTHLEDPSNLNLILPKTNYNTDNKILKAIRKKLVNNINDISSGDSNLIVKKVGSSEASSIAAHGQLATSYEITIGEHEFTLKLNQDRYSYTEKDAFLRRWVNRNHRRRKFLLLPKFNYNSNKQILDAIRKKMAKLIPKINEDDAKVLIKTNRSSKKVKSIKTYNEGYTRFAIYVNSYNFTFYFKQDKYTNKEKEKNNIIKNYFKTSSNLNIILPKTTYNSDNQILEAIRKKLVNNIKDIISSDSYLITKKVDENLITLVANYGEEATLYKITIGKNEFTLKLNQDRYTNEEKIIKINAIKNHFKNLSNLNIILPKTTYDNDDSILEAIKLKIVNDIENITNDDSYLIVKNSLILVNSVATHNETPTQYIITIDGKDFTLNLNQEKFSIEEKNKIQIIKTHLEDPSNLNLILPKTNYNTDNKILRAIRKKLVNNINDISSGDSNLIVKKVGSSEVSSIAVHGQLATSYEITIGEHEFTLKLNQDRYSYAQKDLNLREWFNWNDKRKKFLLPKFNYNSNKQILDAVRKKMAEWVPKINEDDAKVLIKTNWDSKKVKSIKTYNEGYTRFDIYVNSYIFPFWFKQDKYTNKEKEKNNIIKNYFKTSSNLNIILPKTTYNSDNQILEAIRKKLVNNIKDIISSDSYLITKKVDENLITLVANYGEEATLYKITIDKNEFTLKLNQDRYTNEEKIIKINAIKNHFKNLSNLNLILPKTTYDNDDSILEAIKIKLVNDIEGILNSDSHLIIKKESSTIVNEVAIHGETSTQYIINIGENEFTLNLNQEEFSK